MAAPAENIRDNANSNYTAPQSRMKLLGGYYRWQYKLFHKYIKGTVVDLGCGEGHLIPFYSGEAERVIAVDSSAELLDSIKSSHQESTIETAVCDLRQEWIFMGDRKADTVILADVLEHMDDDADVVSKVLGILKPAGRILVKVPAQAALFGQIDIHSGHYRRYDLEDLVRLMGSQDLSPIIARYVNPVGGWIYRFKRNSKSTFSGSMPRWCLKLMNIGAPLLYICDQLPGLKGLSVMGIFERNQLNREARK